MYKVYEIAKDNKKKLDKIKNRIRVYENSICIDYYYKNKLVLSVFTEYITTYNILLDTINAYNSYIKSKRFGKKDLIEL